MERNITGEERQTDLLDPGSFRDDGLYLPADPGTGIDPLDLPFESLDEYSDDPLEYEEISRTLWEDLNDVYILAARTNRHSPNYQLLCSRLEKNIRLAGRLCVTGTVLEQKDLQVSLPEGMCVKELYAMVSLHFRKCDRAYRELRDSGKGLDMSLLDWIIRWASLAEKLKATEEKIRNIKSGKVSAESMIGRAAVFRREPRERKNAGAVKALRRASSLPVLGSYARDLLKQKRREEQEQRRFERELEAMMPKPFEPARPFMPKKSDLARIRAELMQREVFDDQEAFENRIQDAGCRIQKDCFHEGLVNPDSDHKFEEWMAKEEPLPPEEALNRKPIKAPPRAVRVTGPDDETRKKLREKRKKRK